MKKSLPRRLQEITAVIVFILMVLPVGQVSAQQVSVTGVVQSPSGEKLEGVSVNVVNTNLGTSTDADGVFSLNVSAQDSLSFRRIGYEPQTLLVGKNRILTVVLVSEGSALEEVAVVGYGTQRKITLTGAQTTISLSEVAKTSTPSISNAIAGKMLGRSRHLLQWSGLVMSSIGMSTVTVSLMHLTRYSSATRGFRRCHSDLAVQ